MIGPDTTLKDCEIGAGARVVRTHGELAVDRRAGRPSARSPTCGPAPSSAPAARSARSSRPRTPRSATAPRSRTCPTSATPRSARAPTSAPARSSPTTTASRSTAPRSARHARTGSNNTFVAPVEIGDGAVTGGGTVVRRDVPPGALAVSARPAAQPSRAGPQRERPGTAQAEAAAGRAAGQPADPELGSRTPVGENPECTATPGDREEQHDVTGMKRTTEKNLMVFSGRAHPELAEEVAELLGTGLVPHVGLRVRQLRDLRPLRGVGPRLRRLRDPEPHRSDQRVDHGAPDHGRRAQAGLGQADHRGACRSTATPARTRSTAAASRSRPG